MIEKQNLKELLNIFFWREILIFLRQVSDRDQETKLIIVTRIKQLEINYLH